MTNDVKNVPGLRFPGFEDVWKEKNLGRVLDIKSGKAYKENEYTIKGVPLLQGENINHNKLKKPTVFLPDSYLNDNKNTILEKDDIVVGLNRPIIKNQLKIAKVSNEFIPGILYQRSGKIIYDKSKPDFYLNFFDKQIKEFVLKESVGSDQPFISTIQLKKKRVYIPVNENEIVLLNHFFSKLDRQIELEEQKLEKLEEQKKGYMQKIFSQELRFKDENGNDYPEWEDKLISDIGKVVTGNTPSKKDNDYWNSNQYVWVTPTDISNKKNIYTSGYQLSQKGFSKARQLPKNTLLITCIASIGKNAILRIEGSCNQQINAVIPNDNYDVDYLYYAFEDVSKLMKSIAGKTATQIVNKAVFEKLLLNVPIYEEQQKISGFLNKVDILIDKQTQKIDELKLRKLGFLQKMFV